MGGTLGGVALIAMIAAILFFLRRRRRRNATPHPHGGDSNPYLLQDQHHGQSYGGESVKYMYEADGSVVAVHEADGSLDHGLVARELPGSQARINELAGHGEAKELPARETLVELPAPDTIR